MAEPFDHAVERTVEAIEEDFKKVTRGDIPHEGDVLLRTNKGWIFGPPIVDIGTLRWDGNLQAGNVKPIGGAAYIKFSGSNAVPPDEADIYEEIVELGPGNIIEEDLPEGELLLKVNGLYTVSGVVTYTALTQDSQLNLVISRKGFDVVIASVQFKLSNADPFAVAVVQITTLFKQGDRVYLTFGRIGGLVFTADIINADLLAYVVALQR